MRQVRAVIARLIGACPAADMGAVGRGLERLRKACAKLLEAASEAEDALCKEASGVLDGFVLFVEDIVRQATEVHPHQLNRRLLKIANASRPCRQRRR